MKNLIFGIVFLIVSCDHVHVGTVVDKHIEPGYFYTTTYYMTVGKTQVPHTIYHFDDEDYVITIHGIDDGGDTVYEEYLVSYEEYQKISIGYCFNDKIDRILSKPDPMSKENPN